MSIYIAAINYCVGIGIDLNRLYCLIIFFLIVLILHPCNKIIVILQVYLGLGNTMDFLYLLLLRMICCYSFILWFHVYFVFLFSISVTFYLRIAFNLLNTIITTPFKTSFLPLCEHQTQFDFQSSLTFLYKCFTVSIEKMFLYFE